MQEPAGFRGLRVAAFESRMAAEIVRLIRRFGGNPLVTPALREIPLENNAEALDFGRHLLAGQIDAVLVLTGVGFRTLLEVLTRNSPREPILQALSRTSLIARGPKPLAALREVGLSPQVTVPEPNTWRDVLHALDAWRPLAGLRLAVQEYGESNPELLAGLRVRGAEVMRVPLYRWALPEDLSDLHAALGEILANRVDVVLITNAVQIDHLLLVARDSGQLNALRDALRRTVVGSIGPTASERLRRDELPVDMEPSHSKMGVFVKEASEQAHALLGKKRAPA